MGMRFNFLSGQVTAPEPVRSPEIFWLAGGIGLFVLLFVVGYVLVLRLRKKQQAVASDVPNLSIDLLALPQGAIPQHVFLEVYGKPMRLMAFVLAPLGRGVEFPRKSELPELIERFLPGLRRVLDAHQPIYREWPVQLSPRGFMHQFFANLRLPGDEGKGTRWSGIVGPIESGEHRLMAGLILLADEPNGYGEIQVEHAGRWHDVVRVSS
jgi:hypothetical protein